MAMTGISGHMGGKRNVVTRSPMKRAVRTLSVICAWRVSSFRTWVNCSAAWEPTCCAWCWMCCCACCRFNRFKIKAKKNRCMFLQWAFQLNGCEGYVYWWYLYLIFRASFNSRRVYSISLAMHRRGQETDHHVKIRKFHCHCLRHGCDLSLTFVLFLFLLCFKYQAGCVAT